MYYQIIIKKNIFMKWDSIELWSYTSNTVLFDIDCLSLNLNLFVFKNVPNKSCYYIIVHNLNSYIHDIWLIVFFPMIVSLITFIYKLTYN